MQIPTVPANNNGSLMRWYRIVSLVLFGGLILYLGRALFIPLSFAIFISFILQPFCSRLEKWGMSRVLAISTGILLLLLFFALFVFILYTQLASFTHEWKLVRSELLRLVVSLKEVLITGIGFSEQQVDAWWSELQNSISANFVKTMEYTVTSLVYQLVIAVLIPVYSFLILYYRHLLVDVLYTLFPNSRRQKIAEIMLLSIKAYYNFIKGMVVVYFLVGVLNSIGLLLLGVPHALLFGFLTAIMTFIPYIGIIVSSLLPITYAWITYNSIWYPLGVIGVFVFVQYLEANIIFPWAVSYKMELNTLVTLLVIVAGGIIWGTAGMILFVPFAAILKLIADRLDGWQSLARLLGKG